MSQRQWNVICTDDWALGYIWSALYSEVSLSVGDFPDVSVFWGSLFRYSRWTKRLMGLAIFGCGGCSVLVTNDRPVA